MNKPTYNSTTVDLSAAAAAGLPANQPVLLAAPGRPIASILVRTITPVTQNINLHFGTGGDAMPVFQGEVFGEDHVGPQFDAGLYWSYIGAPAAGTVVTFTIFYAPDSQN